mgnify:CR=1 FL=1
MSYSRPTLASLRAQGVTRAQVYCLNPDCRRRGDVELAALGLPDDFVFAEIAGAGRLICKACGSRAVQVMPDWPLRPGMATEIG